MMRSTKFGTVYDIENKKTLKGVTISVFDKQYDSLKETTLTDRYGRFTIFVPKGEYYLIVQKNGYVFLDARHKNKIKNTLKDRKVYRGTILNYGESSYIKVNLAGRREEEK
jgi:hypothetical protein